MVPAVWARHRCCCSQGSNGFETWSHGPSIDPRTSQYVPCGSNNQPPNPQTLGPQFQLLSHRSPQGRPQPQSPGSLRSGGRAILGKKTSWSGRLLSARTRWIDVLDGGLDRAWECSFQRFMELRCEQLAIHIQNKAKATGKVAHVCHKKTTDLWSVG